MSYFEPHTSSELSTHYRAVHARLWAGPPPKLIAPVPPPECFEVPEIEPGPVPTEVEEVAARWREINNRLFGGRVTPKSVLYVTSAYYKMSVKDIIKRSRFVWIARPRQVAIYIIHLLCRQVSYRGREMGLVRLSFPKIARHFSIDHATVMHSIARVRERMDADEAYATQVSDIIAMLGR